MYILLIVLSYVAFKTGNLGVKFTRPNDYLIADNKIVIDYNTISNANILLNKNFSTHHAIRSQMNNTMSNIYILYEEDSKKKPFGLLDKDYLLKI